MLCCSCSRTAEGRILYSSLLHLESPLLLHPHSRQARYSLLWPSDPQNSCIHISCSNGLSKPSCNSWRWYQEVWFDIGKEQLRGLSLKDCVFFRYSQSEKGGQSFGSSGNLAKKNSLMPLPVLDSFARVRDKKTTLPGVFLKAIRSSYDKSAKLDGQFRASRGMLSSISWLWRWDSACETSHVSKFLGKGGHVWNARFSNLDTSGCCPIETTSIRVCRELSLTCRNLAIDIVILQCTDGPRN